MPDVMEHMPEVVKEQLPIVFTNCGAMDRFWLNAITQQVWAGMTFEHIRKQQIAALQTRHIQQQTLKGAHYSKHHAAVSGRQMRMNQPPPQPDFKPLNMEDYVPYTQYIQEVP